MVHFDKHTPKEIEHYVSTRKVQKQYNKHPPKDDRA